MAVLAHSDAAEIACRLDAIAVPPHENLREPENGLVMVRGRIGGDGAPFNLGEATVSRAAVRLASGEVGFGYTLGRDREKARMIALCDALVQSNEFADAVEANVLAPLRAAMDSRRNRKAAETAATRVDFYTLVRGEG
jgi:alpha-D-ribose 1-methylphosphonate 5-triphosphate synthase subunit PhnG